MSLATRILYAAHANGTHHKLALGALKRLGIENGPEWERVFYKHIEAYLEGSKAPDKKFKDFKNHVLHVRENFWGGAPEKVQEWYDKTVASLKAQDWEEAAFNAGVLSHYYTDPCQPMHTGQSDGESLIHRAAEWSINKSYGELEKIANLDWEQIPINIPDDGPGWPADFVREGAKFSNQFYEHMIVHYNFDRGVTTPKEGYNKPGKQVLAQLIAYARAGNGILLGKAIEEAAVAPPKVNLSVKSVLNSLAIPLYWVTRKMADSKEAAEVKAIYDELQETGKVEKNLPEDERYVRRAHAREVLGKTDAPPPEEKGEDYKFVPRKQRRNYNKDQRKVARERKKQEQKELIAKIEQEQKQAEAVQATMAKEADNTPHAGQTFEDYTAASAATNGTAIGGSTLKDRAKDTSSGTAAAVASIAGVAATGLAASKSVDGKPLEQAKKKPSWLSFGRKKDAQKPAQDISLKETPLETVDDKPAESLAEKLSDAVKMDDKEDGLNKVSDHSPSIFGSSFETKSQDNRDEEAPFWQSSDEASKLDDDDHNIDDANDDEEENSAIETSSDGFWEDDEDDADNEKDADNELVDKDVEIEESSLWDEDDQDDAHRSDQERDQTDDKQAPSPSIFGSSFDDDDEDDHDDKDDRLQTDQQVAGLNEKLGQMRGGDSRAERSDWPALGERNEAGNERPARTERTPRFYLKLEDDVEEAPSIGTKTAQRLYEIGIYTVDDLLGANASASSAALNTGYITESVFMTWQDQAKLQCDVPGLRGHDAQFIVGAGYFTKQELAHADPEVLLDDVNSFLESSEGERLVSSNNKPDMDEVNDWIKWAGHKGETVAA